MILVGNIGFKETIKKAKIFQVEQILLDCIDFCEQFKNYFDFKLIYNVGSLSPYYKIIFMHKDLRQMKNNVIDNFIDKSGELEGKYTQSIVKITRLTPTDFLKYNDNIIWNEKSDS